MALARSTEVTYWEFKQCSFWYSTFSAEDKGSNDNDIDNVNNVIDVDTDHEDAAPSPRLIVAAGNWTN